MVMRSYSGHSIWERSPEANAKARRALVELLPLREEIRIYTYPGAMGEDLAKELGFSTTLLGATGPKTKAQDTMAAAQAMLEERVDLLLLREVMALPATSRR